MNGMKSKLVWLMRNFHCGKEKAIKKRDLLAELFGADAARDESYNNIHDRELRAAIEDVNHNEGGLICSSPADGYWWAASLKDGLPAAERNEQRAFTQLENARKLVKNLHREFGGQFQLFETKETA